ncbi:protein FAM200A-like [Diabrotica virgifera virgifera]|uniref:Zinc finger BED domain-containing protein 5 n=1 Tax=Diabrotica virgifera virgifera TaxID=50390 RepID=A0ABM5JZS7_DIAVI|nr:protein FAM200A-like [Diabrotica virgifera virgifera]
MFPSIRANIEEMKSVIIEHLTLLEEKIDHYFPFLNTDNYDWIRNPFISINMSKHQLSLQEEEELVGLSTDRTLKLEFSEMSLEEFWIFVQAEHPLLSTRALKVLLQFATSYLCELGFSTFTNIKTKKRERLGNIDEEMRVALSHIRPDIGKICKSYQ